MAEICKQINVVTEDKVGLLADLTEAIRDAGVNILALCAWVEGGTGHLMAATDDPDSACCAAGPFVSRCNFSEAVCTRIPNQKGELNRISRALADAGISIHTVYASPGQAGEATVVLITSDNAKAAELLP